VASLTYAGYLFGNIPWVKDNLAWLVLGIVVVSLVPILLQYLRERRERSAKG
jgi:membrane-associated protein